MELRPRQAGMLVHESVAAACWLRCSVLVQLGLNLLCQLIPIVVKVAVVLSDLSVFDHQHLRALLVRADARQQLRVVRDDDDAALKLLDRVAQRVDRLHVKVVGGLVEQQDVRALQADAREDDARLLAAAQLADGRQVVSAGEPKAAQHRTHLLRLQAGRGEPLHEVFDRVDVHRERVDKVLRVAPHTQLVRPPLLALGGREVATQQVHERRLAGAVGPHDRDARPHVDAHVDALEPKVVAVGVLEVDVQELDERRRELAGLREVKLNGVVAPARRRVGVARRVVLCGAALARLSRLLLRGLAAHLVGVFLCVLAAVLGRLELLLVLVKRLVDLAPLLLVHLFELRKVALVEVQLEVVQVDDVGGHAVEEVAVVRHHHQRLLPPHQVLLQPQNRAQVQVVRRLVQQQQRGLNVERACERDAHAPAARKRLRRARLHHRREAEAVEDL
mmetsp:Transcript_19691/g.58405  ORF Transcript_19691/g.58405 Transcript_19691/m.58405 type:complete len:447 (-) Transcript_19691:1023-2363(-)